MADASPSEVGLDGHGVFFRSPKAIRRRQFILRNARCRVIGRLSPPSNDHKWRTPRGQFPGDRPPIAKDPSVFLPRPAPPPPASTVKEISPERDRRFRPPGPRVRHYCLKPVPVTSVARFPEVIALIIVRCRASLLHFRRLLGHLRGKQRSLVSIRCRACKKR